MKTTNELIVDLLQAIDKGNGLIEASNKVAVRFGIEYKKGQWRLKKADKILVEVADFFELPIEDIKSRKRNFELVCARYITVVERLKLPKMTLAKAGEPLGLNHATVLYAKKALNGGDQQHTEYYETFKIWKDGHKSN